MVDKNLFLYDLAVVAIFKDEGRYLKEWLDYHLLAGVEHFYLYNNESSDDYKKILAPYVEKNLVTLTERPGKNMQYLVYNEAVENFRFECRYMALIDIDEFIFPKSNRSIVEVVDEILSDVPSAAALAINWQLFGSNGQEKADYSRGVLERFTRRSSNNGVLFQSETGVKTGTINVKIIANPRLIQGIYSPHYAEYFNGKFAVNSNGECVPSWSNDPCLDDKIVINHYFTKSHEEFLFKMNRGYPDGADKLKDSTFFVYDRNEVLDAGILNYCAAYVKNFSFESDEHRVNRVTNSLVQTLAQPLPENAPPEFFAGKLETFLTCLDVAKKSQLKIGEHSTEEIALAWIYQLLTKNNALTYTELQLFIEVLPEIISSLFLPSKSIRQIFSLKILPAMIDTAKNSKEWKDCQKLRSLQRLLDSI